jgi:hypothetical protein
MHVCAHEGSAVIEGYDRRGEGSTLLPKRTQFLRRRPGCSKRSENGSSRMSWPTWNSRVERTFITMLYCNYTVIHLYSLKGYTAPRRSRESSLSVAKIRRAELADGETSMTAANNHAVRSALEVAGVKFIDENGGGPGVRLRKPPKQKR